MMTEAFSRNVSKVLSDRKLVLENFLSIYAETTLNVYRSTTVYACAS